jgi:hypothetical protein
MNNDADHRLDALFRAARIEACDTARAEFGFETRLMARLREERASSIFSWAWKLAPFFAALAIAAGVWSRLPGARTDAEATVLAEAARGDEERLLITYMTGDHR